MSPRGSQPKPPGSQAGPRKSKRWLGKPGKWRLRTRILAFLALLLAAGAGVGAVYIAFLSREIFKTFDGSLWSNPSRVYSAPMVLHVGESGTPAMVQSRLERCNYTRTTGSLRSPGQYRVSSGNIEVYLREFTFPGAPWPRRQLRFAFRRGRLAGITQLPEKRELRLAQIEPEPIASFYGRDREERTVLPLSSFPKTLIDAVLAAEDQRFFSHHGVDPWGILRAFFENLRSGSVVQGGSTITQQTVKNLYLSSERSLARKMREALVAVILDARYPKERILEVYMNEIYLGQRGSTSICGFGEASRFFFGKEVGDLDIAECAMLAGMIRAPAVYSPIAHPDRALARKNLIVQQMREQGRITPDQARLATEKKPAISKGMGGLRRAPYFVDEIRQELSRGHSDRDLTEGGLRIITTLDTWMQEKAEEVLPRGLDKIERDRPKLVKRHGAGRLEGCLIALRPSTGEVLAMVGGRSYATTQFNRATQAHRQPGSLFKPFVYATGFETGREDTGDPFTPATILEDEPFSLTVAGKEWAPHNYDEEYRGPVTAREALEGSLNVPTVRAAMAIGLKKIAQIAEDAGMGHDLKAYPSLALGAQEVVPLDAASAFTIFVNGGQRALPYTVGAVVGADGKVVERGRPQLTRILSPQATYLTLDLMRGVVNRGTAASLRSHGIEGDLAGKTGTTNDKRDAWFIGFRPDLLVLVWVGYDDMTETTLTGAEGAVPIWEDFMRECGQADSGEEFERPEGIVWASIDTTTGGLATDGCGETATELFIDGSLPEECVEHREGGFRRFWRRLFSGRRTSRDPVSYRDRDPAPH